MAGQGLRSVVVKKYNHHADHGSVPDDKENILKRDFEAGMVNRKWCTDITYIHVQKEGWIYLASVMDLCSRKIIGYAYGTSMTAELAVEAVKNACLNVKDTAGIILHSDLGSQYTSIAFESCLAERESCIPSAAKEILMTMPALNRSIQCKFISILTKTLRKPGGQYLNILKAGITASGSTVLSVIWRHSKRRMRS